MLNLQFKFLKLLLVNNKHYVKDIVMKTFEEFLEEKVLYGADFISAFETKIIEKYNVDLKIEQEFVNWE